MSRASFRLALALLTLGTAFPACASNDATVTESLPVAKTEAVESIAHGMDGVTSVHVVVDLVSHVGDDSLAVARSETWADLETARARTIVGTPDAPTSETFEVMEETVIVDGSGYRRSEDSDWAEITGDIGSMVLTGIDTSGDDLAASLRLFARSESGDWTVSTSGSGVTYRRSGDAAAENVVVDIDEDGLLISISLDQRPAGAGPQNPLTLRTTMTFDAHGATVVEVPSDLPLD